MSGGWTWQIKHRNNIASERVYEWYCVRPVGAFKRAYAIRPQYRRDNSTGEELNEIECYIVVEYGCCVEDAIKKYRDEFWFGAAKYGKMLFTNPSILRVCFSMRDAYKVAHRRYDEVLKKSDGLVPEGSEDNSVMPIGQ